MEREEKLKKAIAVCKYYKGEPDCPFDWETQNAAHQFWGIEEVFCSRFVYGVFDGLAADVALKNFLNKYFSKLADDHMVAPSYFWSKYAG